MKILAVVQLMLILGGNCFGQTAAALNTRGYDLFRQGDYPESARLFAQAVSKDPKLAYGWYNLACANAKILEQPEKYMKLVADTPCPPAIFPAKFSNDSLTALTRAVELNPDYLGKCRVDPDLKSVRRYLAFYQILKFDFRKYNDVFSVLPAVRTWSLPGPGAYDPVMEITFRDDGVVEIMCPAYEKTGYKVSGSWYMVERDNQLQIKITVDAKPYGPKQAVGVFRSDGTIELDPANLGGWPGEEDSGNRFVANYENFCSA
jgi:tetratricopeptide (TPR) repeat protein